MSRTRHYRGPKRQKKVPKKHKNRRKVDRTAQRKKLRDGCTGKTRVENREHLLRIADATFARRPGIDAIGTYLCRKCGYEHITTRPAPNCLVVIERVQEEHNEPAQ